MTTRRLTQFSQGRLARIVSVETECASKSRLASLGLVPGEVIEFLSTSAHGHCIIVFKESRMALCWELANCITAQDV